MGSIKSPKSKHGVHRRERASHWTQATRQMGIVYAAINRAASDGTVPATTYAELNAASIPAMISKAP